MKFNIVLLVSIIFIFFCGCISDVPLNQTKMETTNGSAFCECNQGSTTGAATEKHESKKATVIALALGVTLSIIAIGALGGLYFLDKFPSTSSHPGRDGINLMPHPTPVHSDSQDQTSIEVTDSIREYSSSDVSFEEFESATNSVSDGDLIGQGSGRFTLNHVERLFWIFTNPFSFSQQRGESFKRCKSIISVFEL